MMFSKTFCTFLKCLQYLEHDFLEIFQEHNTRTKEKEFQHRKNKIKFNILKNIHRSKANTKLR